MRGDLVARGPGRIRVLAENDVFDQQVVGGEEAGFGGCEGLVEFLGELQNGAEGAREETSEGFLAGRGALSEMVG